MISKRTPKKDEGVSPSRSSRSNILTTEESDIFQDNVNNVKSDQALEEKIHSVLDKYLQNNQKSLK
jgi:hypothetical protein